MKSKAEIKKWLLENCVDKKGNLDLIGLDFSDFEGDVFIGNMMVKKDLYQQFQKVDGHLFQNCQEVGCTLWQDEQKVGGNLYQGHQNVNGDLWQIKQIVKFRKYD